MSENTAAATAPNDVTDDEADVADVADEMLVEIVARHVSRSKVDYAALAAARRAAASASGCSPCIHAAEHGWWGAIAPARSHCRDCHRSWRSRVEGHCSVCHEHFFTSSAFDAHLSADGCRPPASVMRRDGRPRLRKVDSTWGPLWRLVNYRELPEFSSLGPDKAG